MFLSAPSLSRFESVWQQIVDAFKMVIDTIMSIFGRGNKDDQGE